MAFPVRLFRPGTVAYETAWRQQEVLAQSLREGADEALILLQHPPVYTLGRRALRQHVLRTSEELARRGARLVEADRGGDVTFHGPGQLVAYPVLDLRRRGLAPVDYVRGLEQVVIDTLARFGLDAWRVPGLPGAWTAGGKVASIGVRVRGGVTTHGFALNVDTDLSWFDAIVACGLHGARTTSIEAERGRSPCLEAVELSVIDAFSSLFDSDLYEDGRVIHGEAVPSLER